MKLPLTHINIIDLLVLGRQGEIDKPPWEKDNSWLLGLKMKPTFKVTQIKYTNVYHNEQIKTGFTDINFKPIQIKYTNAYHNEQIRTGFTDINFNVTDLSASYLEDVNGNY